MTEAQFTNKVVTYLRSKGYVVFKHSDNFTKGIPDFSVTCFGNTTWFESKLLRRHETAITRAHENKVQLEVMRLLELNGRAYYLCAQEKVVAIWLPSNLSAGREPERVISQGVNFPEIMELLR